MDYSKECCTIRLTSVSDAEGLADIDSTCDTHAWNVSHYRGHLAGKGSLCAIAVLTTGEYTGFICTQCAADEVEIYKVATRPSFRRKGIAQGLLEFVIAEARSRGMHSMHLEVAHTNQAALGLYTKLGFREAYRRNKYYAASGDDAIVMMLML